MALDDASRLHASLRAQQAALKVRVEASGMYLHEIDEFDLLLLAYEQVAQRTGVAQDLGTLTTPESRNLVRQVRLRDGTPAVLKLVGNDREPGEGEVLHFWHERGLPCIRPLRWGTVRVESPDRCGTVSHLLTEHRPCPTLRPMDGRTVPDRLAALEAMMRLLEPFHVPVEELPSHIVSVGRTWAARMLPHLDWTMPLLRRRSLPEPDGWMAALEHHSVTELQVLLHGDPSPGNVLDCGRGQLVLLDPPGAVLGPREADIGHLCAHLGSQEHAWLLINRAGELDEALDLALTAFFAGIDFLLWSGYLLAQHSSPHVSADPSMIDRSASSMLELVASLTGPAIGRAVAERS